MPHRKLKKFETQRPESRLYSDDQLNSFREEVWRYLAPALFVEWLLDHPKDATVGHAMDVHRTPLALYLNDVCSLPHPVAVNFDSIKFTELEFNHPDGDPAPANDIYLVGGFGVNSRTPYHMPQEFSRFEDLVDIWAKKFPWHENRHEVASQRGVNFTDLFPVSATKAVNLMFSSCPRLRDVRFHQIKESGWEIDRWFRLPPNPMRPKGKLWASPREWLECAIWSSGSYESFWAIYRTLESHLTDEQVEKAFASEMASDGYYEQRNQLLFDHEQLDLVLKQTIQPEFKPSLPWKDICSDEVLSGITFSIDVKPEDTPVRGNVLASGNEALNKAAEDEVLEELANDNIWAWCIVTVKAELDGHEASDVMGGCSYTSEEDFRKCDCFNDMKMSAALELISPFVELLS